MDAAKKRWELPYRAAWTVCAAAAALLAAPVTAQENERSHINDNSFLIEEAYNQEPGEIQHVFNWDARWSHGDGDSRDFVFLYAVEIPLFSREHQFSFTPMRFASFAEHAPGKAPEREGGWGDVQVDYRYQFWAEEDFVALPSFAPRLSILLPTGDERRGLGTGAVGYQINLPFSKQIEPIAMHFNVGATYFPDASVTLPNGTPTPATDLRGFNLGGSLVWLANYDLNFLVECVANWNEELDEFGNRARTTEVVINPGIRYAMYTDDSIQWVLGVGIPIGLSPDAPDYGVFVYMSLEHAFRKVPEAAEAVSLACCSATARR